MESDDFKLMTWFGVASATAGGVLLYIGIPRAGKVMAGVGAVAALIGFAGAIWKR